MNEEEKKAIEWLQLQIRQNIAHIEDCKEAVKTKFYYDLDDEISFTQKDLDAETILLNLINDQKAELEKKNKEINRLKDELGYTRKII